MLEVSNKNEFIDAISNEGVALVDFHALWCGPCRMAAPTLEKIAENFVGKVKVVKVDIDKNQDLAREYKIMAVPTFALFKNGELKEQFSGLRSYADFASKINTYL